MTDLNTTAAAIEFPKSLHHATATKARALMAMLAAEYPALLLGFRTNDDEESPKVTGWIVTHEPSESIVCDTAKVPELADILELCEAEGLDPEEATEDEDEDDEPKASGSVVPEHYRQQYRAASSNGQTCGDWLAEWLTTQTHGAEGFVVVDFTAILQLNDINLNTKWGRLPESGQKGWVGRYRMNGRQVMEKAVAKRGYAVGLTGEKDAAPEDFLIALRTKHEKWLAKDAKAEAAATAAIKGAVEGTADEDMGPLYPTEVDEGDNA